MKLLEINGQDKYLAIYPTNTLGGHENFLNPKYKQIQSITIDDPDLFDEYLGFSVPITAEDVEVILESLPSGFTKDYEYGLGLAKDFLSIIQAVEELSSCCHIVISVSHLTSIDYEHKIFFIAYDGFEKARKCLNNITNLGRTAARSVKEATAYNILAEELGRPAKAVKAGRHPLRKLITKVAQGEEPLSDDDQEVVLNLLARQTKSVAEAKPEKLAKLQSDIELVTLELLIERYEGMMAQSLNEDHWQAFFNENPFILNMAFGYPVVKVQDQASVGGRKLTGSGEKITDFLVKNSLTNNTAIFEVKTPKTLVLNNDALRAGIYTPSAKLSGAINQALDQKYQFQRHIAQIKDNSRVYDIESYSVHCCLIIGVTPSGEDRLKSFEMFRHNSKDVEIVTFDELLEKLKQLHNFLKIQSGDLSL
ncbi:MAG: Shedu immune nuclease family protein [Pseudomonadota bacterium]|nr:Shedu immune nuclease family protein [Pseudomonadota bacterium]